MAVRAADRVTLQVLPAPTYVRLYYLLQESTLAPPAAPVGNPPAAPWQVTEPAYTAGATSTLYTAMLTAYGPTVHEWGPVQVSSSYEAAKQAYNLAAATATTVDGSRRVRASVAEPAAPAGGWMNGDQWWQYETVAGVNRFTGIKIWNGSAWVPFQLIADSLLIPGSVGNVSIGNGAIDGKIITGATMRTAATGQRMQFDVNGLRTFNSSNVETSLLESASGVMRLKGAMLLGEQGSLGSPPQISGGAYRPGSEFTHETLGASQASGQYTGSGASMSSHALASNQLGSFSASVSPTDSRIEMDARDLDGPFPRFGASIVRSIDKSLKVENAEGPIILTTSRSSPLTESSIIIGTAAENKVEVRASAVEFNGGFGEAAVVKVNGFAIPTEVAYAAASFTPTSGHTVNAKSWARKRSDGYVYGSIYIDRTADFVNGGVVCNLPAALRPVAAEEDSVAIVSKGGGAGFHVGQALSGGGLRIWSGPVLWTNNRQAFIPLSYFAAP